MMASVSAAERAAVRRVSSSGCDTAKSSSIVEAAHSGAPVAARKPDRRFLAHIFAPVSSAMRWKLSRIPSAVTCAAGLSLTMMLFMSAGLKISPLAMPAGITSSPKSSRRCPTTGSTIGLNSCGSAELFPMAMASHTAVFHSLGDMAGMYVALLSGTFAPAAPFRTSACRTTCWRSASPRTAPPRLTSSFASIFTSASVMRFTQERVAQSWMPASSRSITAAVRIFQDSPERACVSIHEFFEGAEANARRTRPHSESAFAPCIESDERCTIVSSR